MNVFFHVMCLKSNQTPKHFIFNQKHSFDRFFNRAKQIHTNLNQMKKTQCSVANGSNHNEENNHDEQRKLHMA